MTVSEELRQWANNGSLFGFWNLSDEALGALSHWSLVQERVGCMELLDRRTFALLVAEALDGETS